MQQIKIKSFTNTRLTFADCIYHLKSVTIWPHSTHRNRIDLDAAHIAVDLPRSVV